MTSVVSNTTAGLHKKVGKEKKNQPNKSNAVANSGSNSDTNQTNNHTDKAKSDSKLQVFQWYYG